jgi:hypothetical protein
MGLLRSGLPDAQRRFAPIRDGLRERERDENFPVALRVLPKAVRMDLHAVCGIATARCRGWVDAGQGAAGCRRPHGFRIPTTCFRPRLRRVSNGRL